MAKTSIIYDADTRKRTHERLGRIITDADVREQARIDNAEQAQCPAGCDIPEHEHYAEPNDGCTVD